MGRINKDWIRSYMKFTDNTEPPKLYHEWIAVSVIASVLQRKCYLTWGFNIFPNMYVVLVGPSGKCRKGTAMGVGKVFLKKLGIKMSAEAITREALIRVLSKSNVGVASAALPSHCSLTIHSPELTVFLNQNNPQLISDLTDWYDCHDDWTYETKNKGTDSIQGVWVNLLGATTPEVIRSALPADAVGGGLSSRMIFVYETDKYKKVPFPFLTQADRNLLDDLLKDIEQIMLLEGAFAQTQDFLDAYELWYMRTDEPFQGLSNFAGYLTRRATHVFKLCMILTASEGDTMMLTADIFHRALNMLERTERNMGHTFSGYGRSDFAEISQKILKFIEYKKKTTQNEIIKHFLYELNSEQECATLLNLLHKAGRIHITRNPTNTIVEIK